MLEVNTLFVSVNKALWRLLVNEHLASFLSEGIVVAALFYLVSTGHLLGVS